MTAKDVWKYGYQTETIKPIEDEGPDDCTWPDRWVHKYVKMSPGDIVFVTDGRTIARVKCILMHGMYFTMLVSEEEALKELAANAT